MGKEQINGGAKIPQERGLNGGFERFAYASNLNPSSLIILSFSHLSF